MCQELVISLWHIRKKKVQEYFYFNMNLVIIKLNLYWSLGQIFRVCLVGGVEKWEDRKWWEDRKMGDKKDFNFPSFCLVESEKVEEWKKWVCINLLIYPC